MALVDKTLHVMSDEHVPAVAIVSDGDPVRFMAHNGLNDLSFFTIGDQNTKMSIIFI